MEIADHRRRWGPTGMRATRQELVAALMDELLWVLTDIHGEQSERTSDPKYSAEALLKYDSRFRAHHVSRDVARR